MANQKLLHPRLLRRRLQREPYHGLGQPDVDEYLVAWYSNGLLSLFVKNEGRACVPDEAQLGQPFSLNLTFERISDSAVIPTRGEPPWFFQRVAAERNFSKCKNKSPPAAYTHEPMDVDSGRPSEF